MKSDILTLSGFLKILDMLNQKDFNLADVRKIAGITAQLRAKLKPYQACYTDIEMGFKRLFWDIQAKYAKEPESAKPAMQSEVDKVQSDFMAEFDRLNEQNKQIMLDIDLNPEYFALAKSIYEDKLRPNIPNAEMAVKIADLLGIDEKTLDNETGKE